MAAWYAAWLTAAYFASGGAEFDSDAPTFIAYVENPSMLLSEVPREQFGASVAAPLMPWEIATAATVFRAFLPDFVAFRAATAFHVLMGMAIAFGIAFRERGPPISARNWLITLLVAILPVGWCASVIMSQDDCVSALWSGLALLACVYSRPVVATVIVGLGIFFAKPFLAITFLAIWICSPGERLRVGVIATTFVAALLGFYLWRDGTLPFGEYMVVPYMGASPYGIAWLLLGSIEKPWMWWIKDFAAVVTAAALGTFAVAGRSTRHVDRRDDRRTLQPILHVLSWHHAGVRPVVRSVCRRATVVGRAATVAGVFSLWRGSTAFSATLTSWRMDSTYVSKLRESLRSRSGTCETLASTCNLFKSHWPP